MSGPGEELGGDPPCWAHLFDEPITTPDDPTLADLVRSMADAVIIADAEGIIVFWNQAAERVFGWTATDAIGTSLDLIIPERQRSAHWAGYERVMATGHTRYGDELLRVPALHADGERRSIAFTVSLLTDSDNAVTGIAAVVRDETQRWADERALRAEVASLRATADEGAAARPD
jgi:PAS domain S-box-containing protein